MTKKCNNIHDIREKSSVVITAIVMSVAEGIVKNDNSGLLKQNGGHIRFSKHWAKYLLSRMGFVKRRVSTKSKVSVAAFESLKAQFFEDIKVVMCMKNISDCLVINWDQTGINYIPFSSWTMHGKKRKQER